MPTWLFRILLRSYPRAFRAEYGATLLDTISTRANDARARGGWARGGFIARECVGLVAGGLAERRSAHPRRGSGSRAWAVAPILRASLRQLGRHPLYAAACIGTLALGVAATGTSLAILKGAFLDPLPYADDDELVSLFTHTETWPDGPVSAHVVADLRGAGAPIAAWGSMRPLGVAYSDGSSTESIGGIRVTPEFFATLGVRPAQGRVWAEGETDAVVVSRGFWQTALAADPAVLGRRVTLDGVEHTIVGVLPGDFVPPFWPNAAVLLPLDEAALVASADRALRPLSVIVRRAPGATDAEVNAYLAAFSTRLQREHPRAHAGSSWHVVPLRTFLIGDARTALIGTGAAAALLLLIVVANTAGLSAARAIGERHQTAVQLALGASRRRLIGERMVDGAVLSLLGAGIGVWLAHVLVSVLTTAQPQFLERIPPLSFSPGAALLILCIGVAAGTLAVVLPWGAAIVGRPASLMGTRGAAGGTRVTALRSGLVVLQVATALVLVVGAGLLVRTMQHLGATALGFDPAGLVTMSVSMPRARYAEADAQIAFERAVVERLERIPGVTSATASVGVPIIGGGRASLRVFGRVDDAARGEVAYLSLAPDFMDVTGMRLLEGRGLDETDRVGGPGVVVVNESAARRFWHAGDAIGARIRLGRDTDDNEWITIVGIVADIRQHGPTEQVLPTAFGSTWQFSGQTRWFTVRAATAPASLTDQLRAAVYEVDAGAPVVRVTAIEELVANTTARHRLVLLAFGFYGGIAVVLCAFGVHAVVSLTSRLRRREYAIRMAVGAHRRSVHWLVMRQALVLAGLGVAAGLAVAAGGTRALGGLLHGVRPLDAATFAVAVAGVLALTVLSAWWPANRAGRVDPAETLKD
jgi:putative ABC transport system permease protein